MSTIKDVRRSNLTRETLAMDLKGPFPSGEHLLVIIDYRSRYPIPKLLDTITSTEIRNNKKAGRHFLYFATLPMSQLITASNSTLMNSKHISNY